MAKTCDILDHCADWAQRSFPGAAATGTARDAALYRAHTEAGASLRSLAREIGRHPSTVMRAVQRVEEKRDDPIFDRLMAQPCADAAAPPDRAANVAAPCALRAAHAAASPEDRAARPAAQLAARLAAHPDPAAAAADERPGRAAKTALRRLSEPGAFLLVAPGNRKGGIFCAANEHRKPIAMLELKAAGELVRRDWIRLVGRGAASLRYRITEAGRAALKRLLAEEQAAKARAAAGPGPGLAEAPTPFQAQHRVAGERLLPDPAGGRPEVRGVNLGESPLGWLARRKGPDGQPFLTPAEVEAGERLRDQFEAAQIGPRVGQDWAAFLTPCDRGAGTGRGPAEGPAAARERVRGALDVLGPGLSDVALRVCCFLEGLEACEKRMGWSARSGKVVLKLALQRLVAHYGLEAGQG
ncbi:DUF6456 domain-containing protein [Paralimibaculum aggregatum]|uniref:DUF6456 domain-containing protein n=1 Tax=Paralimibaculum aggregatum TaxID=3036245 RepID=A0ABQ6LF43_9RHOB|nr:DUF6456 domain-containing protein [Limibaculum sp. NKW23]GMG80855.1 DUF6456 domain-containing protein [Limibaculum sp. NKW23]